MTDTIQIDPKEYAANVYEITPEQAQHWLDHMNTKNRKVRVGRVKDLARQMSLGYWNHNTHEGIAFATDGTLLDGQHRLAAVALHGRPVKMLVWTGIAPTARLVVGDGAPRTAADSLRLVGHEDVTRNVAGTLRVVMDGFHQTKLGQRPSTSELEDMYIKHKDAVEFAHKHLPTTKGMPQNAGIRGAVARAYYHVAPNVLEQFCETFVKAMPASNDRDYSAPLALRSFMVKNAGKLGSSKARARVYRITENMISRFIEGQNVQLVKGASRELYPLPDKHVDHTPRAPVVMRRRPGEATVRIDPAGNGHRRRDAALDLLRP